MKKLLLFVIAIATFQFTQAQTKIGIKGGANFSTYVGSDVENAKMLTGFHAGLFANLPITEMIRIQPEVVYSVQGAKTTFLEIDLFPTLDANDSIKSKDVAHKGIKELNVVKQEVENINGRINQLFDLFNSIEKR